MAKLLPIFILATIFLSASSFSELQQKSTTIDHKEAKELIAYFIKKIEEQDLKVPKNSIQQSDIQELGMITGIHYVVWEGDDGLYSLHFLSKNHETNTTMRYAISFTVSPKVEHDEPGKTLSDILDGRKLTQLHIWKVNAAKEGDGETVFLKSSSYSLDQKK